jgi:hypothetical protein
MLTLGLENSFGPKAYPRDRRGTSDCRVHSIAYHKGNPSGNRVDVEDPFAVGVG